jgi:hypothetical protein
MTKCIVNCLKISSKEAVHPLFSTFNTLRRDRYESSGGKSTTRGGELLTYTSIHSDLYLITERCVPNVDKSIES